MLYLNEVVITHNPQYIKPDSISRARIISTLVFLCFER